jgi:hypothetical protein
VWSLARARAVLPPQQPPLLLRSRCLCSDPSRADARAFAGIFVCRLTLHVCGVDRETAWTALNLSHAGFSFYYVHWLKGMPMFRCARAAQALRAALAADRLNCALSPGCVDSRVSPAPPANAHAIAPRCVVVAARRGTPDYDEKYDRLTFWEQLDGGTQYTLNKKFLTIIPIVLFLFTISNCAWLAS